VSVMASEISSEAVTAVPDMENEGSTHKRDNSLLEDKEAQTTNGSSSPEMVANSEIDISLPLNWPLRKKVLNMAIPTFICFVV